MQSKLDGEVMMAAMKGLLLLTLLAGSLALPQPETDNSFFFNQVDPSERIVGGDIASVGSHPHMVAMSTGVLIRSFLCGGSLITTRTVLTAAHCIDAVFSWGSLTSSLRVTVGTNRWNSGGASYSISRNITHPNYLSATIKNDLGLLITSSAVALNDGTSVIPINYDYVDAAVTVRAAGWGRTVAGGSLSADLREVVLATIGGEFCVAAVAQASIDFNVRSPPVEPHIELCTFHSVGRGTCNGDSGSALVRTDISQQVGIVSWGFPCARGAPDMFVRVSAFQDWLQNNIQ